MITKIKKAIAKKNTRRRAIVHFMMTVRAKKVENSSNEQCRHHRDGFIATIYLELFNASVELLFNHGIKLNKNTKSIWFSTHGKIPRYGYVVTVSSRDCFNPSKAEWKDIIRVMEGEAKIKDNVSQTAFKAVQPRIRDLGLMCCWRNSSGQISLPSTNPYRPCPPRNNSTPKISNFRE